MKLVKFFYDIQGVNLELNILASSIEKAIPIAHKLCADNVGDNFKYSALQGDYLKTIAFEKVHKILED
jgi:hypothetical protein